MEVLEPGSGPGFVTELLLRLLPHARVTCVDLDPLLASKAKEYLARHAAGRFRIVEGSVTNMDLPEDSFDFAYARFLFEHLRDPAAAAREIFRVLKPGGKLVIADIDDTVWGLIDPEFPEMATILDRVSKAQAARGGDRHIGRRLWGILASAGFREIDLEVIVAHSHASGLAPFLPMIDPDRLLPLLKAGLLTDAELMQIRGARERFVLDPNASVYVLTFLACGAKPARRTP